MVEENKRNGKQVDDRRLTEDNQRSIFHINPAPSTSPPESSEILPISQPADADAGDQTPSSILPEENVDTGNDND